MISTPFSPDYFERARTVATVPAMSGLPNFAGLSGTADPGGAGSGLWFQPVAVPAPRPGGGAVATYVSLFLILFVFFIVLFSIASIERAREAAMLASLDAAFDHMPSAVGLIPAARDETPPDPASAQFIQDAKATLAGVIRGSHAAAAPPPGTILSLVLSSGSVFEPDTADLRPAALPALTRLAVLMQRHRGESRYQIRVAATAPATDQAASHLARMRVEILAARLYAEGCPSEAVTVAVSHAADPLLRLDFSTAPAVPADD